MKTTKGQSLFFAAFSMLLLSLLLPSASDAGSAVFSRCKRYLPQVTREAHHFIGPNAPHHLFMGQIEQESRCNEGITAFDGGKGLGQFMPDTAEWMQEHEKALKEISMEPNPYDPRWSIRALVLYDNWLYGVVACKDWYFAFRAYNGGAGVLGREIERARSCDLAIVERNCKRKIIRLKGGKLLDMCTVNISYPRQISQKGEKYK